MLHTLKPIFVFLSFCFEQFVGKVLVVKREELLWWDEGTWMCLRAVDMATLVWSCRELILINDFSFHWAHKYPLLHHEVFHHFFLIVNCMYLHPLPIQVNNAISPGIMAWMLQLSLWLILIDDFYSNVIWSWKHHINFSLCDHIIRDIHKWVFYSLMR